MPGAAIRYTIIISLRKLMLEEIWSYGNVFKYFNSVTNKKVHAPWLNNGQGK
jgi:hypothetical protein